MSNQCNCVDTEACAALPPVIQASNVVVLNESNCQRTLTQGAGTVLYSDGVNIYWADGGNTRPLAFPSLLELEGSGAIPNLVSKLDGGVLAAVYPPLLDGMILESLGGEWIIKLPDARLCYPEDDIILECCCPGNFAVWVLDETDPENPQYCLRRFNLCEDALEVQSGPLISCDEGCITKLVGTSEDQVPAWDPIGQVWVPTEVSSLVPTPDSVLDTVGVVWAATNPTLPVGAEVMNTLFAVESGWTIAGSGAIATSAANAVPYAHNSMIIANAGWHELHFTVSATGGAVISDALDPATGINLAQVSFSINGSSTGAVHYFPITVGTVAGGVGELLFSWAFSGSLDLSRNFVINDKVDLVVEALFSLPSGAAPIGTYESDFYPPSPAPGTSWTLQAEGTITRIT